MSNIIKLLNNNCLDQQSIKHDYIKVRATSDQSKADVGALHINYDTVDYNIGNSFELSNGKVKIINENIHHVRVTSVAWIERGSNSYAWYYNTKNGNNIGTYMLSASVSENELWQSVCLTTIVGVQKNDIIYPYIYFSGKNSSNAVKGGTYSDSVYMIVEAID